MKKQSAHSCIKDNRFIYGTRDDTGRSLMSQVSRCPNRQEVGQWDRWDSMGQAGQ